MNGSPYRTRPVRIHFLVGYLLCWSLLLVVLVNDASANDPVISIKENRFDDDDGTGTVAALSGDASMLLLRAIADITSMTTAAAVVAVELLSTIGGVVNDWRNERKKRFCELIGTLHEWQSIEPTPDKDNTAE